MQAAPTLARLASKHAHDKKFPSPYSQEAVKQGIDLPWFLRLANASFTEGKFKLGHMKVGPVPAARLYSQTPLSSVTKRLPFTTEQDQGIGCTEVLHLKGRSPLYSLRSKCICQ